MGRRGVTGGTSKLRVLVLGAGKIGVAVAGTLAASPHYSVTLVDRDAAGLAARTPRGVAAKALDGADAKALARALGACDAVVSALPFFLDAAVARAARRAGVHYFDLTEDVATARAVREAAEGAESAFVPQCGLAPGFVAVVANHLVGRFDEVEEVKLRVGALPQFPDNALKYNLTWSTDGLINEYCNPCQVVRDGAPGEVPPLEGLEHFSFDGVAYEAFSTSGGVGTLCESLAGRVRSLNYKTVRYPGHRDMMRLLAHDLRLCQRRQVFKDVIEHAVPVTRQDVVLILVSAVGRRGGQLTQETYARKIYGDPAAGGFSAIQKTTAAGVAAMIELHRKGRLPRRGFVRQEEADFAAYVATPFGRLFA